VRLSVYIAKRYLFARKSRNAINIISGISVAGVSVGTMALIIILSVFNGLEEMVSSIFNTFDPEIRITAAEGKVFIPDQEKIARLNQLEGIYSFSLTLEENAMFRYEEKEFIASVRGVDDNYPLVTGLDSAIIEGEFRLRSPGGRPEAVIGAGVASRLGLNIYFIAPLQIWVPRRTGTTNLDPEDAFIKKYISPSGVFRIEQEFDSKYVLIPLDFARDLLEYDAEISSIEIKTENSADPDDIKSAVKEIFGSDFNVRDRLEQQSVFYKVMRSERLAIFIILTLILLIASFNIIGSLTMLIIEKERDIEILKSLGADNSLIRRIFIFEGWLISIIGAATGLLLGFIICWLQMRFGFIQLSGDTLIMKAYPVVLKLRDFITVPATVLLIGYWAAWYPVLYLTKKYLVKK
jgi:lipoprotein-releasing system permease protein